MNILAKNISVDAGIIIVCDLDYYKNYTKEFKLKYPSGQKAFSVPKGTYKIRCVIPRSWNGKVSKTRTIKITSGKLVISDPCYIIDNEMWDFWLDETNYGEKISSNDGVLLNEMGGDGSYNVRISLTKV